MVFTWYGWTNAGTVVEQGVVLRRSISTISRKSRFTSQYLVTAVVLFLLAVGVLIHGGQTAAWAAKQDVLRADQRNILTSEFDFLFTLLVDESLSFRPSRIKTLLRFAMRPKGDPAAFKPPERDRNAAAYWETDLNVPMEKILRYLRDPDIPNYLFFPASLRLDGVISRNSTAVLERGGPVPLPPYDQPVVLRWVEYEVNAPDKETGTYYRYEKDRMVLLFQYEGQPYQVSVSKFRDKSTVSQKGVVVRGGPGKLDHSLRWT
jgi:hypothetical protein